MIARLIRWSANNLLLISVGVIFATGFGIYAVKHVPLRAAKRFTPRAVASVIRIEPARPSFGQLYGLHDTADSLDLKSSVALVLDQDTNEVLFRIRLHPLSTIGALPAPKLRQLVEQARQYSFDFLEWKKAFVLSKNWLAHKRSIWVTTSPAGTDREGPRP